MSPGPWLGNVTGWMEKLTPALIIMLVAVILLGLSRPPDHYIYHHQQDIQQETQRCENADEKRYNHGLLQLMKMYEKENK